MPDNVQTLEPKTSSLLFVFSSLSAWYCAYAYPIRTIVGGHMDIQTKYGWQELYATALLETDWSKIEEKIQVADNGIRARLHEFSLNHGGTPEEN